MVAREGGVQSPGLLARAAVTLNGALRNDEDIEIPEGLRFSDGKEPLVIEAE
jgi:hypothetical protein